MKYILLAFFAIIFSTRTTLAVDDFFQSADNFFRKYVVDGKVNYGSINKNELQELVNHLATSTYSETDEKAYLINAYNIFVIAQVVENYGKIKRPTDLTDFFTGKNFVLNNEITSLDFIENGILRKKYNDPLIHFALVCGAISCPPIVNYVYKPNALSSQLEERAKFSLNNNNFVFEKDGANQLSQIFEWFQSDFGKNKKEVIAFINKYRDNQLSPENKIRYYPYNWTLNDTKKPIMAIAEVKPAVNAVNETLAVQSQISSTEPERAHDEINLQTFTAGSLLRHKQMDFTLFNTIYTETKANWKGDNFSGYRGTFGTHLIQWTYGISENRRINLGIDLNIRANANNANDDVGGIWRAYSFKNNDSTRFGLGSVGLRAKVQPFSSAKDFSIQSTVLIPTIKHPEGFSDPAGQNSLSWADWNRITWWNQIFYSKTFGDFQLFTEIDFLFRFRKNSNQIGMLDMPLNVFLSYFPTNKITLYAMTQHVPRFTNNIKQSDPPTDWVIPMNYTASGAGFKYNFTSRFLVELLYTNFWRGTNSGLGSTFNLGLKYLTK